MPPPPRFLVCQLYQQAGVWLLHLWRWPVPGARRRGPVWASLPGLGLDRPVPGQRSPRNCTQTCSGARPPVSPVGSFHQRTLAHKHQWNRHITLVKVTDCKSLNQVRTENLFISLHRWFLKSEAEGFLVSDRKPACVFPIHFGKCNTQMGLSLGKARKSPRCFEGVRKIQRFKNGFSGTFEAPDLHLRLTFLRLPATLYSALPDTCGCDLVLYPIQVDWLVDWHCTVQMYSKCILFWAFLLSSQRNLLGDPGIWCWGLGRAERGARWLHSYHGSAGVLFWLVYWKEGVDRRGRSGQDQRGETFTRHLQASLQQHHC